MILNDLLSRFEGNSIHRLAGVINIGSQVIKSFEQEYANDQNAKNAAIDLIVEILQGYKDKIS